ncbi:MULTISPECIES: hypothetical protein [unclassified Clostridium]|uniref:hypothetical protein n=1 Tax=unclassified Clostridium TaxID=2614128 RepID=UPI00029829E4|nr:MULTISPECIES: hypothetical protein [unclassified Clostridium]EKQ57446.1 MAG: hypothetical protein A370_00818 [Clostridium sp. Maddingley MBC34-26]
MNPSYFRIKLPKDEAISRLTSWLNSERKFKLIETDSIKAINLACNENGTWKSLDSVFLYENEGWTVFEDLTGGYSGVPSKSWLNFAQKESFVFAGYNDAICYGELIVIEDGKIIREFLEDQEREEYNKDVGELSFEKELPIESWREVADFVDNDDLAFLEYGWLLIQE